MTVPTGIALWALSGHSEAGQVKESIQYLLKELNSLISPLSLGWTLIGLSSWGIKVDEGEELISRCLVRQQKYGAYNTSQLAILLLSIPMMDITGALNV
jgi:hypothetical protein